MIQPKEYFERFIAWKRHPDPKSPKVTYESYSAMDLNMLTHEMDFGIPGALEELGERYLFGLGLSTDVDKALELFQAYTEEFGSDEAAEHEIAFLKTR